MRALYVVAAVLLAQSAVAQEKLVGSNVDVRTGLTFKVSDGVVQKMLPEGWEVNSPTAGPTKGSNVNLTLIDQIMAQDPEGKALNPFRGAALSIPAKKKGTETAGTMVFAGLMTPPNVPGAYGAFVPANAFVERSQRTDGDGKTVIEENWQLKADDGSAIEVQIQYVRGVPARGKVEAKVYAAIKPDFYRIYRFEQAADVARSTSTGIDRVSKISFKVTGAKLAPLFDGSQQLISVTSVPWYSRQVSLPGS